MIRNLHIRCMRTRSTICHLPVVHLPLWIPVASSATATTASSTWLQIDNLCICDSWLWYSCRLVQSMIWWWIFMVPLPICFPLFFPRFVPCAIWTIMNHLCIIDLSICMVLTTCKHVSYFGIWHFGICNARTRSQISHLCICCSVTACTMHVCHLHICNVRPILRSLLT